MKTITARSALLLALALAGCVLPTPAFDKPAGSDVKLETGSLKVDLGGFRPKITVSSFHSQALPLASIVQARITVHGHGLREPIVSMVPVSNGTASVEIRDIPVGPNRLLVAEGLDASGSVVPGAVLQAIATVQRGAGIASLTWYSTPAGQVLERLLSDDRAAGTTLVSTVSSSELQDMILQLLRLQPPQVQGEWHPSLIKAGAIAERIRSTGGAVPLAEQGFIMPPAALICEVKGLAEGRTLKVRVTDPASRILVDVRNGHFKLPFVTPGTWSVVFDSPDFGAESVELGFVAGASRSVVVDYSGSEKASLDFGSEATGSVGDPLYPTPAPSPTPTPAPSATPSPAGDGFYNLFIRFDQ